MTLKKFIHGRCWAIAGNLRLAVFQFIDGYCNRHRPHSTNNYRPLEEQECQFVKLALIAA